MKVEPQKEHRWLEQLVGEWTVSMPACDDGSTASSEAPSKPWSETTRMLHGVWLISEGSGEMPDGGSGTNQLTLGYDPAKQRYVGTWVGSMMTHLWVYEGALDPTGKVLTLDTVGPGFEDPAKSTRYQDVITIEDDNNRTLSSRFLAEDGTWKPVMTMHYRRKM
ncbi:MAG: DUF1579 domain-containing protein [Chelatococcus sp.]|jgi:hypothetical protein|uniref:DUF1579 domain-containing protein n=1 Tax=Chelatococcus sp. TaxID=1953771 RepID=UPI0025C07754|nr:DUF1579 domain-containing protein [Chelatococcus sp.]MBX3540848.1 DUF1579 domain-containing protein [Chelatococcus sp.]